MEGVAGRDVGGTAATVASGGSSGFGVGSRVDSGAGADSGREAGRSPGGTARHRAGWRWLGFGGPAVGWTGRGAGGRGRIRRGVWKGAPAAVRSRWLAPGRGGRCGRGVAATRTGIESGDGAAIRTGRQCGEKPRSGVVGQGSGQRRQPEGEARQRGGRPRGAVSSESEKRSARAAKGREVGSGLFPVPRGLRLPGSSGGRGGRCGRAGRRGRGRTGRFAGVGPGSGRSEDRETPYARTPPEREKICTISTVEVEAARDSVHAKKSPGARGLRGVVTVGSGECAPDRPSGSGRYRLGQLALQETKVLFVALLSKTRSPLRPSSPSASQLQVMDCSIVSVHEEVS